MRIIMLQATPGSIDGIRVTVYEADTEYDLTATDGERDLAAAFVGADLAIDLDENAVVEPVVAATPEPVEIDPAAKLPRTRTAKNK